MPKRYIFLSILLVVVAFGLTQLPEKGEKIPVKPEQMLLEANDQSRYLSTHFIAKRLIERDPSLLLIDVRTIYENEEYSIPGSFSIPLEEITNPDWEGYIDQDAMDIVFYSNSDIYADQAWMLSAQKGYKNLYVMKGGLNEWFRTIIKPTPPDETSSSEAFELYSFERAASIYFGGSSAGAASAPVAKKNVVVRKKEKKAAEGGC
ncbi:MAG: rhodanese-like domain-containing protein [Bacteroidota bacterium]